MELFYSLSLMDQILSCIALGVGVLSVVLMLVAPVLDHYGFFNKEPT